MKYKTGIFKDYSVIILTAFLRLKNYTTNNFRKILGLREPCRNPVWYL
jgi:hypothetical protein